MFEIIVTHSLDPCQQSLAPPLNGAGSKKASQKQLHIISD